MSRDDQRLAERLGSARRPVMKALGAGGVLGALGWTGTSLGASSGSQEDDERAVHTVETLAGPPTNPNRPADFYYQPTGLHVDPGDVVRWRFVTPDHNVVGMHPAFGMRRRVPLGVDAFSSPLLGWTPDSIADDQVEPPALPGGGEVVEPPVEGTTVTGTEPTTATGGTGTETMIETDATPPTDTETTVGGEAGEETTTAGAEDGEETTTAGAEDGTGTTMEPGSEDGPVPDTWLLAFDTPGVYDVVCSPHEGFGMAMRIVVGDETSAEFETSDPAALPEPRAGPVGLARLTLTDPALEPSAIVDAGTVDWQELQANQPGAGGEGDGVDDGEDDAGDEDDEGTTTVG